MTETAALWTAPPRNEAAEAALTQELGLPLLTARLLVNRGISDPDTADAFLHPALSQLHDPFLLPDMDRGARRIADAVQSGETVFIYGDYDVDGVSSTAVYVRALAALGAKLVWRVPHRRVDGYDLRVRGVEWAHEQGAKLVITSDCGIQSHAAVARAAELGMATVITDHHEPGDTLPAAHAVINPHRHDSTYPFPMLAGVGVAYKVCQAVTRLLKPDWEAPFQQNFLDLAACGTVADVMPLTGENRVLASLGLKVLRRTKKAGLRALLEAAGINTERPLTSEAIGFGIGPRINAVGRLGDAAEALELLLTTDADEAGRLAGVLNEYNVLRKGEQQRVLHEAEMLLAAQNIPDLSILVLASPGWNAGVVGLAAGRIAERTCRPTIVIGVGDDGAWGKGSARSAAGYNIFAGISSCRALLETCGGHEGAAGLSLNMTNFDAFHAQIASHAASVLTPADFVPRFAHDGVAELSAFSVSLLDEWNALAPFGNGNPEPLFVSESVAVCDVKRQGKDQNTLKLRLREGGVFLDAVGFRMGDWAERIGARVDVLYSPSVNEWNGKRSVQLKLHDLRPVD